MLWKEVLANWENWVSLKYPQKVKGKFQWSTSVLKNNGNVEYKQSVSNKFQITIRTK